MPSVETQTAWSWVKDLSVLSKIANGHKELQLSLSGHDLAELQLTPGQPFQESSSKQYTPITENPDHLFTSQGFLPVDLLTNENQAQSPKSDKDLFETANIPEKGRVNQELHLPMIPQNTTNNTDNECSAGGDNKITEDFKLPQMLSAQQDDPALLDILDEGDIEQPYAELPLSNLPWPKILQYMRESESYASRYFSIQNKHAVLMRFKAAMSSHRSSLNMQQSRKANLAAKVSPLIGQLGNDASSDEDSMNKSESELSDGAQEQAPNTPRMDLCDFCGKQKFEYSILGEREQNETDEQEFCCDEYKEFCILVATYLRKLIDKLQNDPPKKISVKLTKKQIKKTAEQRAFAMMCRKKKWEQLLKRKMQKNHTTGRTMKQTRTIQFSLLSTETLDTDWMVRPQSKTKHCTPRKRKFQEKYERKKRQNILPPGILKRLHNDKLPESELDLKSYIDSTPFVTLLPNRTGQCKYRSGNLAVAIFSPYSGVLSYFLYEDTTKKLLAYLDELGQTCCYYSDGKIQLYSDQEGGMMFEADGLMKHRWKWDTTSNTFRPTTIALNKHLTVKCQSKRLAIITFTSEHKVVKFTVSCQLQEDEKQNSLADNAYSNWLGEQLHERKKQISGLLLGLQSVSRSRKIARLKSVYDPLRRETDSKQSTRQRTKSTGAIPLNIKRSTHKHTHTNT